MQVGLAEQRASKTSYDSFGKHDDFWMSKQVTRGLSDFDPTDPAKQELGC